MGGANIINQFESLNVIDEYKITTMDKKIGSGIPL
jgi:dihydrofolate reductase